MNRVNQWLVGANAVEGVLNHDAEHIIELVIVADCSNHRALALKDLASALNLPIQETSRSRLDQLAEGRPHQGIGVHYAAPGLHDLKDLEALIAQAGSGALLLALDGVEDPGNLGAILRTAECAGVTAVLVPKHRAATLTTVARKAASGAAERVPVVQCTNLARALESLKAWGIWIYGAAGEAPASIYSVDFKAPVALVMGSEGKGLRPVVRKVCDALVNIPIQGAVGSLNVGAASAVCLFEVARQRGIAAS